MINKNGYKNLVLAGASVSKNIIESSKLFAKYAFCETEYNIPDDIREQLYASESCTALQSLVTVAGCLEFNNIAADTLRIMYADTVSLYAMNHPDAEQYFELVYTFLSSGELPSELPEMEKRFPKEQLCWIRQNI